MDINKIKAVYGSLNVLEDNVKRFGQSSFYTSLVLENLDNEFNSLMVLNATTRLIAKGSKNIFVSLRFISEIEGIVFVIWDLNKGLLETINILDDSPSEVNQGYLLLTKAINQSLSSY